MSRACPVLSSVLVAVLAYLPAVPTPAATLEYQFFPLKTEPQDQGWSRFVSSGDDTPLLGSLQITDTVTNNVGAWYRQNIDINRVDSFEVRARARITEYGVPAGETDRPLFVLRVTNGSTTYGRMMDLGISKTNGVTTIGFVNTNGVYFGTVFTTNSSDLLEILWRKAVGTGGLMTVDVNGNATPLSVSATSTEFLPIGNNSIRNAGFGMLAVLATGTAQVVGCTVGELESAPPINDPPGTVVVIH